MASEIEAAAERYEAARKAMSGSACCPWECEPYASTGGRMLYLADEDTLANAYLARLAADRAEREERARPIDADLLPCPCCGNARPRKEPRMVDADDYGNKTETGVVFCRDCGLNMETCHGQQEAESRWNRRDLLRVLKGGAE